jgi:hypothetical protein
MNYRQYDSTIGRFYSQDVLPELSSSITFSIIQKEDSCFVRTLLFYSALNYSGLENNLEVVLLDLMQTAYRFNLCYRVLQKIIYYE